MNWTRSLSPKRSVAVFALALGAAAVGWNLSEAGAADEPADVVLDRGQPYLVAAGRSPIPNEGERIDEPLPFRRLVDERGADIEAPSGPVSWGAAHNYIGQRITVEGTIVDTYNHQGNICFLNFDKNWQGKFYIPVFSSAFDDLPRAPERYFLNKKVRVTGTVSLHRNRPNIEVRDAGQIKIVR